MKTFPFYKQHDATDCGPTCLRMIAKDYGKSYSLQYLRRLSHIDKQGASLLDISEAAENIGFRTNAYRLTLDDFKKINTPFIAHWNQDHFVVVYSINKKHIKVADPALGKVSYTFNEFKKHWISTKKDGQELGIILELHPTPAFYTKQEVKEKGGFTYLFSYLLRYKNLLSQLFLGMIAGSSLQLIFPFLTQAIVDIGISTRDINFIYLILMGQLMLFAGRISVEIIRSWILLHIGTRVNISLISDFLLRLLKLPLSFFDTRMVGDLLQRIQDHSRIEYFLTSSSLNALFSFFNILVFGLVLLIYNPYIFAVFFIATLFYFAWVLYFLKKRAIIDHKKFGEVSENHNQIIQMIQGVKDIKLFNSNKQKRWDWEQVQASLFNTNVAALTLDQYQVIGAQVINQLKNILIIFMAAQAVVTGGMTLGEMLAVQFIVGELNGPIDQLIGFIRNAQDARISLDRIGEIKNEETEEEALADKIFIVEETADITLENVSFRYGSSHNPLVLSDLNFKIPYGRTTAIVGASGSGKTTLLKLLLKFYKPTNGSIYYGKTNIQNIRNYIWRNNIGVVLQDGYIFKDSIARNIALGQDIIDRKQLNHAVSIANIKDYIESLPLAYNTKIASDGVGLSAGQKQRLLIARAVYKDPSIFLLDEATNALDANNEKAIVNNLKTFLENKTVVVVAHRLSTVKNADQIIVLDKGKIVEQGKHEELAKLRGNYYELVKNQLELGV